MAGVWLALRRACKASFLPALAMLIPACASAQVIDQYFAPSGAGVGGAPSDQSRGQALSRFDTNGVQVGSFVIRPDFSESLGYTSNVQGFQGAPGSLFERSNGSVTAASNWSRDSAYITAGVVDQEYFNIQGQNFTNWNVGIGGTVDVGSDKIGATYSHLNLTQIPGSIDTVTVTQPVSFRVDAVQLSYTANDFGRFGFIPEVDVTKYDFENYMIGNQIFDQVYRNRVVLNGSLTTLYELAPERNLLFVVQGNHISYLNNQPGLPGRDNNNLLFLGGIDYSALGSVFRFRALAGMQIRNYVNSAAYSNFVTPTVEASVTWTPTRLTTVTALARRDIQDAADESIAAYTYTAGRLSVDHELLRNVLLDGFADVELANFQAAKVPVVTPGFQEAGTSQVIYTVGASATWLLNRNLRAALSYNVSDRQGSQGNGNFFAYAGLISIGLRL